MRLIVLLSAIACVVLSSSGCGGKQRLILVTGTTVGLKATPGDLQQTPPQVTIAYKRTEFALAPGEREHEQANGDSACEGENGEGENGRCEEEAQPPPTPSSLAIFSIFTEWFGDTAIHSIIATGCAADALVSEAGTCE